MMITAHLPIRTAPEISQKVASQQAWRRVSTFEPTLVPNELATSLAPMPNAKMKAITKPTTTSHNNVTLNGSIVHLLSCGYLYYIETVSSVSFKLRAVRLFVCFFGKKDLECSRLSQLRIYGNQLLWSYY